MDEQNYIELIRKAQRGDKRALDRLAELAANRLRVYVYRLTLADDLTQEIVQETMLEMCRILGKLKEADKFWPWLYGIATNKIRRHRRTERTQKSLAKSRADQPTPKQREQGFQNLVSKELKQIIATAMQNLRTRHRAVDGRDQSEARGRLRGKQSARVDKAHAGAPKEINTWDRVPIGIVCGRCE